jgi:hypothetical protein
MQVEQQRLPAGAAVFDVLTVFGHQARAEARGN